MYVCIYSMYIIYSYSYSCLTDFLADPIYCFIVEDIGISKQPSPQEVLERRHLRVKSIIKHWLKWIRSRLYNLLGTVGGCWDLEYIRTWTISLGFEFFTMVQCLVYNLINLSIGLHWTYVSVKIFYKLSTLLCILIPDVFS